MLQEAALGRSHILADKGHIVAMAFQTVLQGVEHLGEEFVGQAPVGVVLKENTHVIGLPGAQGTGGGIGMVAQLLGSTADPLCRFRTDVRGVIQSFADGGHGDAASSRNIFQCRHFSAPFIRRIYLIVCVTLLLYIFPRSCQYSKIIFGYYYENADRFSVIIHKSF